MRQHFCKKRHRKKVIENVRKFISQERYLIIFIWSAHCLYFTEIDITNLQEISRKLSYIIFSKNHMMKDCFKVAMSTVAGVKFWNSDSLGLNKDISGWFWLQKRASTSVSVSNRALLLLWCLVCSYNMALKMIEIDTTSSNHVIEPWNSAQNIFPT